MHFVHALSNASTSDPCAKLNLDAFTCLHHPPAVLLQIEDSAIQNSISTYLAFENASQAVYESVTCSLKYNFPNIRHILSFYQVKKLISMLTGVDSILHNMCPNTCLAFTGPFSDLDECPLYQAS